MTTNYFLMNYK